MSESTIFSTQKKLNLQNHGFSGQTSLSFAANILSQKKISKTSPET